MEVPVTDLPGFLVVDNKGAARLVDRSSKKNAGTPMYLDTTPDTVSNTTRTLSVQIASKHGDGTGYDSDQTWQNLKATLCPARAEMKMRRKQTRTTCSPRFSHQPSAFSLQPQRCSTPPDMRRNRILPPLAASKSSEHSTISGFPFCIVRLDPTSPVVPVIVFHLDDKHVSNHCDTLCPFGGEVQSTHPHLKSSLPFSVLDLSQRHPSVPFVALGRRSKALGISRLNSSPNVALDVGQIWLVRAPG
ncbi:hypothetical protein K504DRAFT_503543 [Pleomassaria siparia CBS 279.74]|uniref:Uncharacterized protein n=1 Tax=Pleomassaria siparia CBS 279.74 TaxID=1314801 RepID=A0A6G1K6E2_9PLEO|nr:hypothetical protein K504DRAFT_503543 [Pleomassaria siparia CBS 279.74]